MSIDKIIFNTPMNEMARKTHLKIYFDNKEETIKMGVDTSKKICYIPHCKITNITKMELGEYKVWTKSYFLKNFDIKSFERINNVIYINELTY